MDKNKPIFYDTDCLSCFLIIGETFILESLFSKIILPIQSYREISNDSSPYIIKKNLEFLEKKGFIEIRNISSESEEYKRYILFTEGRWGRKKIGEGEASAISLAIENNGIVASNNLKDVKSYADEYNFPILTTAIILSKAVDKRIISENKANDMWEKMLKRNRRLQTAHFQIII
ncbi:hypothetical protein [Methanobrevibacter sp. DSM 116169]|uniref:hypothetical protein n=1 Tax=Methanobrevibacter sp. DSM 116169 TaxID=3242727 RepID=UPI0038FD1E4C